MNSRLRFFGTSSAGSRARFRSRVVAILLWLLCGSGALAATGCSRGPDTHAIAAPVATSAAYDPPSSELRFRRYLLDRGVPVDRMTPVAGAGAWFDFYAQTRFAVVPEGDVLRIVWQAGGAGDRRVRLTLARDFVWPSDTAKERVERWSMWMTFHASAIDTPRNFRDGSHRCTGPEACAAFLRDLPLYRQIADRPDDSVEIGFDPTSD